MRRSEDILQTERKSDANWEKKYGCAYKSTIKQRQQQKMTTIDKASSSIPCHHGNQKEGSKIPISKRKQPKRIIEKQNELAVGVRKFVETEVVRSPQLQSTSKRRRYMRRGSKCPSMMMFSLLKLPSLLEEHEDEEHRAVEISSSPISKYVLPNVSALRRRSISQATMKVVSEALEVTTRKSAEEEYRLEQPKQRE